MQFGIYLPTSVKLNIVLLVYLPVLILLMFYQYSPIQELQGNDNYPDWDSICIAVLGRKLSIWDEFLKGLFFDRAKVLKI